MYFPLPFYAIEDSNMRQFVIWEPCAAILQVGCKYLPTLSVNLFQK